MRPSQYNSIKATIKRKGGKVRPKEDNAVQGKLGAYRLNIKPLSVNQCWQGRRFKTKTYKNYENALLMILPQIILPEPPYEIYLRFGFSSRSSDFDNPMKPMIDILQKKYLFNDKLIQRAVIDKELVIKGEEFIEFRIEHFEEAH